MVQAIFSILHSSSLIAMIIGACTITLHLHGIHSLKEKRSIVKSVLARLRNEFNISAAEVDAQDSHGRAVIGVACVSATADYARGQLDAVLRWLDRERPDAPVIDYEIELL
jgi:uncharacterized protein YlxP (DUF503 family)